MTQQNRTESPEIDQTTGGNLAYNNNSISNHWNIDYLKNCIKTNDKCFVQISKQMASDLSGKNSEI